MIHSVSTTTYRPELRFEKPSDTCCCGITYAKLKKFALAFFAAVAFFFATTSLLFSFTAAIIQTGLIVFPGFLIGGILVYLLQNIIDYDVPENLDAYRKTAREEGLHETIATHGWANMFFHGIPLPQDFPRLFRQAVKPMTLKNALEFYEEAKAEYEKILPVERKHTFMIPEPSEFREKWLEESQQGNILEIVDGYDINKLRALNILVPGSKEDQALVQAQGKYPALLQVQENELTKIEKAFHKKIKPELIKFLDEIETLPSDGGWIDRIKNATKYFINPNDLSKGLENPKQLKQDLETLLKNDLRDKISHETFHKMHKSFKEAIRTHEEERDAAEDALNQDHALKFKEIDDEYKAALKPDSII